MARPLQHFHESLDDWLGDWLGDWRGEMMYNIIPPVSSLVSKGLDYSPEISLDVRHLYYRRHPL